MDLCVNHTGLVLLFCVQMEVVAVAHLVSRPDLGAAQSVICWAQAIEAPILFLFALIARLVIAYRERRNQDSVYRGFKWLVSPESQEDFELVLADLSRLRKELSDSPADQLKFHRKRISEFTRILWAIFWRELFGKLRNVITRFR